MAHEGHEWVVQTQIRKCIRWAIKWDLAAISVLWNDWERGSPIAIMLQYRLSNSIKACTDWAPTGALFTNCTLRIHAKSPIIVFSLSVLLWLWCIQLNQSCIPPSPSSSAAVRKVRTLSSERICWASWRPTLTGMLYMLSEQVSSQMSLTSSSGTGVKC